MSQIIKIIGIIAATVSSTSVAIYYAWQIVFSTPLLKSLVGTSVAVLLLLSEIIVIWLLFRGAQQQKQKLADEERTAALPLPPGQQRMVLTASASLGKPVTAGTGSSRRSGATSPLLFTLAVVVLIAIFGVIVYRTQPAATISYLPISGNPVLSDSLQHTGQWSESNRSFSGESCQFLGGSFHVHETQSHQTFSCPSASVYSDFAFQVQMRIVQGGCAGLDVRSDPDSGTGYVFSICQDGTYELIKDTSPGESVVLQNTLGSSAIHGGLNQLNLLAVTLQGNSMTLYINRQQIKTIQDESYSTGHIAFLALSKEGPAEVAYANAMLWTL